MKFVQTIDFDFIELLSFWERPFKAKFIPQKVWNDLDKYKNDSNGLKNYFKKWKTRVLFKPLKRKMRYVPVGGEYNTEIHQSEVHIYCNNFDRYSFDDKVWKRLKYKIIQVTMHEFIHCRQYYSKDEWWEPGTVPYKKTGVLKIDTNRHYHSNKGEIEAYAHCIFLDYKCYKPKIPLMDLIRRSHKTNDSTTFAGIVKLFNHDNINNHALPLLAKKILTWDRKYKAFFRK